MRMQIAQQNTSDFMFECRTWGFW